MDCEPYATAPVRHGTAVKAVHDRGERREFRWGPGGAVSQYPAAQRPGQKPPTDDGA